MEIAEAEAQISTQLKTSIQLAISNITKFHDQQIINGPIIETMPGVQCWSKYVPIDSVGLYIPGGTAPLFSSVLMLAIPARIANCKNVILCSPPSGETGRIHPAIIYAASISGVHKIYKLGGIQAIAAMALGTGSVPKVDKIFGPGNQYVMAAKNRAFELGIGIDMPAGPSEVLVIADDTANPAFVASDLLAQAEHGVDSQVVCIANSVRFLGRVNEQIETQ